MMGLQFFSLWSYSRSGWLLSKSFLFCQAALFLEKAMAQSCPTLCNPMDCSLPGSSDHRIRQARILEWGAISFFRGSSQPLLQGIFPTRSYLGLPHCGQILHHLSQKESPIPSPGLSLTTNHTSLSPRPGTGRAVCC